MKLLHVVFIAVIAVFALWLLMKHRERFTELKLNFAPSSNGLEQDIRGYAYALGDKRSESDIYFGFDDSLRSLFSHFLLPKDLKTDLPAALRQ
jgi:hypothetical protein